MKARVVGRWTLVVCAVAVAGGVMAASGSGQPAGDLTASRYTLSTQGSEIGTFNSLQGLSTEVDVTAYLNSADKNATYQSLAGRQKPLMTLRRPKTASRELWAWHEDVVRGGPGGRRNVELRMRNADGKTVAFYYLEDAFPSKLSIGAVNSTLTETVTIVGSHIQRVEP